MEFLVCRYFNDKSLSKVSQKHREFVKILTFQESLSIFYLSAKRLDFRQTADYNMAKISPAGRSSSGHILEDNYGLFNG